METYRSKRTKNFCRRCGKLLKYNKDHDAAFCIKCDIWTDIQCGDPYCGFCKDRPPKPSLCKVKKI